MRRIFVGEETGAEADLGISREKLAGIIELARMYDAREENADPDSGSNATDDGMADVLEDRGRDSLRRELIQLIRDLNLDEQATLVALAWIGRGTYSAGEWDQALTRAREAHNSRTAQYLLGLPLLSDYLETGAAEMDSAAAATSARQFS